MPLERFGRLARLLVDAGLARESRLTLAGWVNDWPSGSVWCWADDPLVPRTRPAVEAQDVDLRHVRLRSGDGSGRPSCSGP